MHWNRVGKLSTNSLRGNEEERGKKEREGEKEENLVLMSDWSFSVVCMLEYMRELE